MHRSLVVSTASSLRLCSGRPFSLAATNHVGTRCIAASSNSNKRSTTLPVQSRIAAFSTNADSKAPPPSAKESPSSNKLGLFGRIRHMLRSIFGSNDDTPRGIQERKDMYWIVLAAAHRKLRMENQRKKTTAQSSQLLVWQQEEKDQLKDMMDEAASHLDEKTNINEMSLRQLRNEIQSLLEPQIMHLLTVAHDVEEEMKLYHSVNEDEEDEDYNLSEKEEQKYREILHREYDNICKLLQEERTKGVDKRQQRTSDPIPFYEVKKGAIETLLTYFRWWPEDAMHAPTQSTDKDEKDNVVDEFGFQPNNSDTDILKGMRYYHLRNLTRSSLVRSCAPDDQSSSSCNSQQTHCYHSILSFKSTIPSAGRGVYVDGFAPAGTLLALFPGKVWPKEHLMSASLQTQLEFSENDPRHQLSMRYDDILIDSRQSPYTVVNNLWSLGHIVNHPPAPTATAPQLLSSKLQTEEGNRSKCDNSSSHHPHQGPNCVTVPINFTDKMLQDNIDNLRDYLPNEYELPPKDWAKNAFDKDEIIMHGMGLVAQRDVKDEELFYDYRLSPDNDNKKEGGAPYPSWYYVWDQEAISNRWDISGS